MSLPQKSNATQCGLHWGRTKMATVVSIRLVRAHQRFPLLLMLLAGCAMTARRVRIPGGVYNIGCSDREVCKRNPLRTVRSSGFEIDQTLVTVGEYRRCVAEKRCPELSSWMSTDPREIAIASYEGAQAFCRFRHGHVPSAVEWEIAARGRSGNSYPWGNVWKPQNLVQAKTYKRSGDVSVAYGAAGTRPDVRSQFGVQDLSGAGPELVSSVHRGQVQTRGCGHLFRWIDQAPRECSLARLGETVHSDSIQSAFRCAYSR